MPEEEITLAAMKLRVKNLKNADKILKQAQDDVKAKEQAVQDAKEDVKQKQAAAQTTQQALDEANEKLAAAKKSTCSG